MTLYDVVIFLILLLSAIQFWHVRGITERANVYLKQFCEQRNLQLISVARQRTRIAMHRGKPDWHTFFEFEFSGNGADKYSGQLEMKGRSIVNAEMPAYRID